MNVCVEKENDRGVDLVEMKNEERCGCVVKAHTVSPRSRAKWNRFPRFLLPYTLCNRILH
jgi:hypothetical protein